MTSLGKNNTSGSCWQGSQYDLDTRLAMTKGKTARLREKKWTHHAVWVTGLRHRKMGCSNDGRGKLARTDRRKSKKEEGSASFSAPAADWR